MINTKVIEDQLKQFQLTISETKQSDTISSGIETFKLNTNLKKQANLLRCKIRSAKERNFRDLNQLRNREARLEKELDEFIHREGGSEFLLKNNVDATQEETSQVSKDLQQRGARPPNTLQRWSYDNHKKGSNPKGVVGRKDNEGPKIKPPQKKELKLKLLEWQELKQMKNELQNIRSPQEKDSQSHGISLLIVQRKRLKTNKSTPNCLLKGKNFSKLFYSRDIERYKERQSRQMNLKTSDTYHTNNIDVKKIDKRKSNFNFINATTTSYLQKMSFLNKNEKERDNFLQLEELPKLGIPHWRKDL
ncbi:uncharacterized protein [Lepeophtheirus salmonis]|nr:uncharacterized protein LOC121118135 [Lepeophtheirus salmonis]